MMKPGTGGIRLAAVAGRFYPDNPVELRRLIENLLLEAEAPSGSAPKALIAPHAGYVYSGPVAASAYAHLSRGRSEIERVVLVGPSHFVALQGMAASSAQAFATPLGLVPVDLESVERLLKLPGLCLCDEAHAREHSLEVHLPFLQVALGQFKLVPLVVGDATPQDVSRALDLVWGGPETCVVVSSDLSHYLDSESARQLDRVTANAIERLAPEQLGEDQACGLMPIRGLLRAASMHGLRPRTVDLRNSGDIAGPRDQVVGYGAFTFGADV